MVIEKPSVVIVVGSRYGAFSGSLVSRGHALHVVGRGVHVHLMFWQLNPST
jgi:hypothetical protein